MSTHIHWCTVKIQTVEEGSTISWSLPCFLTHRCPACAAPAVTDKVTRDGPRDRPRANAQSSSCLTLQKYLPLGQFSGFWATTSVNVNGCYGDDKGGRALGISHKTLGKSVPVAGPSQDSLP